MHRTDREVAVQAIICGTLGFRASLEVTEHPRAKALCCQLLPWLEQLGLMDRIETLHHEILASAHGRLNRELQTEAFWRGETASFLGWTIQLFNKPDPTDSIDPGLLVNNLKLLQPTASELISSAKLRPQLEIENHCAFCLTVRHQHQLSVLREDGQVTLGRFHQSRLIELGLSDTFHRLKEIDGVATTLASTTPSVKGLYVVRALAAEWLLSNDE